MSMIEDKKFCKSMSMARIGLMCAVGLFALNLSAQSIAPIVKPPVFSRDKAISMGLTNGVYSVRHWGQSDWAVTAFPVVPARAGDRFTCTAEVTKCGERGCHASTVLQMQDGSTQWGYAVRRFTKPGRQTWTFAVPPGAKSVQLRFGGLGVFEGEVRNLSFTRVEPLKIPELPKSWQIGNNDLTVEVFCDGNGFAVTDRRTGRTWKPHSVGGIFTAMRAEATDTEVKLELMDCENLQQRKVKYSLSGNEVDVTIDSDHNMALERNGFTFPTPFATEAEDALIAPLSEGYRLPFAEKHKSIGTPAAYNSGLCMPFFGVEDGRNGSGWMAILMTPDDASLKPFSDEDGRMNAVAPQWLPRHGTFGYARTVKFAFLAKGGYVAMAKRYRAEAMKEGLIKTFREKVKERPLVDRLLGAANVWYYGGRRGVDAVAMAEELRAAGITRFLWSAGGSSETVTKLSKMPDVLVGRYDVYRDVYRPEQLQAMGSLIPSPTNEICRNTSAWPHDVIWNSADSNDWRKAWGVFDKKGNKVYCAALCGTRALQYERRNVSLELKTKPYNTRFIDVTTAVGWEECANPAHPMSRSQSRAANCELLRILGDEFGLVVGSEQGMGAAVPVCDYFEGMLSPWYARMPHGRKGAGRYDIFRDPPRPTNVTEKELAVVEKYATSEKYRIPLFELVFHDCCCAHWYWFDYSNRPLYLWRRRDLLNALYGTMPMFIFDYKHWQDNKERFKESYALTAPIARRTGYAEMLDHRVLTKDRTVQQTVFSDGTRVTVNFSDRPFKMADGSELAPMSVSTK